MPRPPARPGPVLLLCAVCYRAPEPQQRALQSLQRHFGPIGTLQEPYDFTHTRYYEPEMGPGLKKRVAVFRDLILPDELPRAKRVAGEIEDSLRDPSTGSRAVNLDPGYLAPSRLVLASTKDFAHRLYLDQGIFGEVTLLYHGGRLQPLPWTYPDYREEPVLSFLQLQRKALLSRLREMA